MGIWNKPIKLFALCLFSQESVNYFWKCVNKLSVKNFFLMNGAKLINIDCLKSTLVCLSEIHTSLDFRHLLY